MSRVHRHQTGLFVPATDTQGCVVQEAADKALAGVPRGMAAIVIVLDLEEKGHATLASNLSPESLAFVLKDMEQGIRNHIVQAHKPVAEA